jgi:hypothetical protein
MSKKDGFSTNAETLADFRDISQQVFARAYEQELGEDMHPGFEDKPLTSLYLTIEGGVQEPVLGMVTTIIEKMTAQPINEGITNRIDSHPYMTHLPEDVKERYTKIGEGLSAVALSKGLSIISVLPMEAVNSNYAAYMSDDTIQTAGVFMEKPDRMRITAAKYFAQTALRYVQSDEFASMDADDTEFSHFFGLDMEPNLPLNGHEHRVFLIEYRREMIRQHNRAQAYLQNRTESENDEALAEMLEKHLVDCANAVERADRILMHRNDYE